jgi:hypothetical protein
MNRLDEAYPMDYSGEVGWRKLKKRALRAGEHSSDSKARHKEKPRCAEISGQAVGSTIRFRTQCVAGISLFDLPD